MKRIKIISIGIVILLATVGIFATILLLPARSDNSISKGLASKMLALLDGNMEEVKATSDYFHSKESKWYEKYMNYMYANGLLDKKTNKPHKDTAAKVFNYGDLRFYLEAKQIEISKIKEVTGIDCEEFSDKDEVKKTDFMEIYEYLVAASKGEVCALNFVLCGTPANIEGAKSWICYTSIGELGFEGLAIDRYMDNEVMAYVRDNEIIAIVLKITDEVTYHNAWLEKGSNNTLIAYIGSAKRTFYVNELSSNFEKTIGDVSLKGQQVTGIVLKPVTINGKVLLINEDKVEIEGYGEILIEDNFKVYKNYGVIEEQKLSDILVGYDLTDFVVADGKICAAIISRDLHADNIRVMVMSTGFTSLFHQRISLTGTTGFTLSCGEVTEHFDAGEILDIYPGSSYLTGERITICPDNIAGKITLLSVKKGYGNPSYGGKIEIGQYEEGLTIINDIPLEEYLYAVVPSEMPTSFGVEALKVQAVCARSYAYKQLLGNAYSMYGAHVDDSTNFQVYNNSATSEDAIQAVRETYGLIATYNDSPISTYYYSTSCGVSADIAVWNSNVLGMPFLVNKGIDPKGEAIDLSGEEAFKGFIKSEDASDFDYGFPYYRWNSTMTLEQLSTSINSSLFARYCASPGKVLVKQNDGWVSQEIRSIGALQKIEVTKRSKAGAVLEIVLYGSENTVKVSDELGLRYLLNVGNAGLKLFDGGVINGRMLPSAYCYFEPVKEGSEIIGYTIWGGGNGHGIGMSQNAVSNMVKSGMSYDEILTFFYEGTSLMNMYDR